VPGPASYVILTVMSDHPQRFGSYELLGEIARGGQGVVYRARGAGGEVVALKLLLQATPVDQARFEQEARTLARLEHPHLLRIVDAGRVQETPYLGLEYVEGEDLRQFVRGRGVPSFAWTVEILEAIAGAVAHCHQHGVVHRDIKPANILVERGSGRPVLVDFGLIKRDPEWQSMAGSGGLTATGEVVGTPSYMAPEQAVGGQVGPSSDVYSLGATLYWLLTGRPPFPGPTAYEVLQAVVNASVPDPTRLNPGAPAHLSALCRRAMAKSPEQRPPSAAAFAAALSGGRPASPRPQREPGSGPGPEPGGRRRGLLVLLLLLALIVALGVGRFVASGGPRPPASVEEGGPASVPSPSASRVSPSRAPPSPVEAALERAAALCEAGDHRESSEALAVALKEAPVEARLWRGRGEELLHLGEYEAALDEFDEALRLEPEDVQALGGRAEAHFVLAEPDKAVADLRRALEIQPDDPGANGLFALILWNTGRREEALGPLERALRGSPDEPVALRVRAQVRSAARDFPGAAEDYGALLGKGTLPGWIERGRADLWSHLARCLDEQGRSLEALEAYERCLTLEPRHRTAYYNRGNSYLKLGRFQEALEDFTRSLGLQPGDHLALTNRAATLIELGRPEEALRDYQAALESERSGRYLSFTGNALELLRREEEALACYQAAIDEFPDESQGWIGRGELRLARGEAEAALEDFRRAVREGGALSTHLRVASALRALGETDDARRLVQELIDVLEARQESGGVQPRLVELLDQARAYLLELR